MGVPFQVTFQEMWPTDEVMAIVRQQAEGLRASHGDIERYHVVIDRSRRGRGKGRKYRVSIEVGLGEDAGAAASSEHARLHAALARAFHLVRARVVSAVERDPARGDLRTAA